MILSCGSLVIVSLRAHVQTLRSLDYIVPLVWLVFLSYDCPSGVSLGIMLGPCKSWVFYAPHLHLEDPL